MMPDIKTHYRVTISMVLVHNAALHTVILNGGRRSSHIEVGMRE